MLHSNENKLSIYFHLNEALSVRKKETYSWDDLKGRIPEFCLSNHLKNMFLFSNTLIVLMVWFGLVSLFNGISTFVGYQMLKPLLKKDNSDTIFHK